MTKIKVVFILILVYCAFIVGNSFLAGIIFAFTKSMNTATHISRCVFSIPFLYVLFKGTKMTVRECQQKKHVCRKEWLILSVVGIVLGLISKMYGYLIQPASSSFLLSHDTQLSEYVAYTFGVLIVAPIVEEMFFRKWMISYLERNNFNIVIMIIISSTFFFIGHIDWTRNLFRFDTFVFAVILCCIYIKYHDVRLCMFVHFVNNLVVNMISYINYNCIQS